MTPTPGIGQAGEGWIAETAVVLLGAAVAAAVGFVAMSSALPPSGRGPGSPPVSRLRPGRWLTRTPLAGTAGLALWTPLLYLLWRLGLPGTPAVALGAAAALGVAAAALDAAVRRSRAARRGVAAPGSGPREAFDPPRPEASRSALRSRAAALLPWLPAAAALGAFVWKLTRVPVWSWDHYAIWGVKARRIFPEGALDPAWAAPDAVARPDYPLGLPLAWRALTLGVEPGPAAFLAAHALMAAALVALAGRAAARLSGSRLAGGAAAALVAASPLVWDTESLGLADLPLALWAVAAVAVVAAHAAPAAAAPRPETGAAVPPPERPAEAALLPDPRAGTVPPLWVAGVCLGFLPWLKSEGLPLALGLLAASALILRHRPAGGHPPGARRRSGARRLVLALALPALLLGAAGLAAIPGAGDRDLGFFRGDWVGRGLERLPEAAGLMRTLAADLAGPEWLGIWWLYAAAVIAAILVLRRRRTGTAAGATTALALAAAVGLQLALYLATYLVSYIPAEQHAATSFHRVAAALAPLALLAGAAVLGAVPGTASAAAQPGGGSSAPGLRR